MYRTFALIILRYASHISGSFNVVLPIILKNYTLLKVYGMLWLLSQLRINSFPEQTSRIFSAYSDRIREFRLQGRRCNSTKVNMKPCSYLKPV
jgi:hypothetical protein